MGLRVLAGTLDGGDTESAVLYCSTSMTALPWMFDDADDAIAFVEKHGEIRRISHGEQEALYDAWQAAKAGGGA